MLNRPEEIGIFKKDIPNLFEDFLSLVGTPPQGENVFKAQHRFYRMECFYIQNKDRDWGEIEIPDDLYKTVDEIAHFVVVLKNLITDAYKGKPAKCFLVSSMIDSYCAEAMILSNYVRRGYMVQWLSILAIDPPDVVIYDPANKINVDIEVKVKVELPSIKGVFASVNKGLDSLSRREAYRQSNPAIIAIHCPINLGWSKWLTDVDVQGRIQSRLENNKYSIVSGLIFSGGHDASKDEFGSTSFSTHLVGFRSHVAKNPLPFGLLTGSESI